MSLSDYKLTEEQKNDFLQKQAVILNDSERRMQYQNFVFSQQAGFLDIMNHINRLLFEYKQTGKISSFVEFRARIKDAESAITNDFEKHKLLDDIFGMELICATETEIDFLVKELKSFMKVQRYKNHNKANGYKAKHYYLYLNPQKYDSVYPENGLKQEEIQNVIDTIPVIEFQLKTIEVAINAIHGTAAHSSYKDVNPEKIQDMFDKGKLMVRH